MDNFRLVDPNVKELAGLTSNPLFPFLPGPLPGSLSTKATCVFGGSCGHFLSKSWCGLRSRITRFAV